MAAVLLLGVLSGCNGGTTVPGVRPGASRPSPKPSPQIRAEPRPGQYSGLQLAVTLTADPDTTVLFFDLNRAPVTSAAGHVGKVNLTLLQSASIHVLARDAEGAVSGPYTFDYQLLRGSDTGGCALTGPPKYFHKADEPVRVFVSWGIPNALSDVEISVSGGASQKLSIFKNAAAGATWYTFTPTGLSDGEHVLGCRVVGPQGVEPVTAATHFYYDATPPMANWRPIPATIRRVNWPREFALDATDQASGLSHALVCEPTLADCANMAYDEGRFSIATAVTLGTSAFPKLWAQVFDRAGNRALAGPLQVNLVSFAETDPPPFPIRITTAPFIDFSAWFMPMPLEVRDQNFAYMPPPYHAVWLADGWNEFWVLPASSGVWRSVAVYKSGVRVSFPPSNAPWLAYASTATGGALQLAQYFWRGEFSLPALEVPHLLFVEDLDANGLWSAPDVAYVPVAEPTAPFAASYMYVLESQLLELRALEKTNWPPHWVSVGCAPGACMPGGSLVFEHRALSSGYPATHVTLPGLTLPAMIQLPSPSGGLCSYFWDANGDGVGGGAEARTHVPCDMATVTLGTAAGELTVEVAGSAGRILGVEYGASVTAVRTISNTGMPLLRTVAGPFEDRNGLGVIVLARMAAPAVPLQLDFYSAGRATSATLAPGGGESGPLLTVNVRDENGVPSPAYVLIHQGGFMGEAIAGTSGVAMVPITDPTANVRVIAYREGYLSVATQAVGQSPVAVRLFSAAKALKISGHVTDAASGAAVPGASLEWRAGVFEAHVLAGENGAYALPAAGYGELTVRAPGYAAASFPVAITSATTRDIALRKPSFNARGVLAGGSPPMLTAGPRLGNPFFIDGQFYAAALPAGEYEFSDDVGLYSRKVSLPGALPPPIAVTGPSFPFVPVGGLKYALRCGDLRQRVGVAAVLEPGCWSLYANDAWQTYFLGSIEPPGGFSTDPYFKTETIAVYEGTLPMAPRPVFLHDRLWNRTIRAEIAPAGMLAATVPYGIYTISLADGTTLRDPLGYVFRLNAYPRGVSADRAYAP